MPDAPSKAAANRDPLLVFETEGVHAEVRRDGSVHVRGADGHDEQALDIGTGLWRLWNTALSAAHRRHDELAAAALRRVFNQAGDPDETEVPCESCGSHRFTVHQRNGKAWVSCTPCGSRLSKVFL